ncbi:piwi-like protein 1 isoform X1 [Heterocephalus glaber]|uniref:Piwi-like protein 1 isoform X1 n=1 Tax=Heterocephalus glaber TaxID=10181 RepID=A0AAX6P5D8_HETGA|nr:piwi-like protein 1 isoform X1 [Heterocephalus glaber]
MTGRARARARGRARGQDEAQHMGAALSQQPGYPQPRLPHPLAEGDLVGRGRQRGAAGATAKSQELQISAGFQELSLAERGGRRRRDFHDLGVNTRQSLDHVKESKTGSSGIKVRLSTNHFRLTSRPQWALYQYHVDYSPLMEARRLRSALLFQHEDLIGRSHAFDGTILFLPIRLQHKVTELSSLTRNGERVRITIALTNELPPTSPTCLQFYNIIFRRLLKIMNLQQIGRNYYNPHDPIDIPNHRLVIWPGFTTSILQYENNIMLCTDVSHKVLRSETVLDFMLNLYHQTEGHKFQEQVAKELIGLIVLTKYNNKTYRVDDIDWDQNPKSTFKKADGSEVSFLEYYQQQYNQEITDLKQPVLVSQPKRRRGPGGTMPGPAMLIPELCYLTGLTDKMRNDFTVMKELAAHTRLTPEQRQREVGRLIDYIHKDDNVQRELRDWGLSFDSNLLSFSGRILQTEKIHQGGKTFDYSPQFADWSKETRGAPLISARPLDNWLMIYTRKNYEAANSLIQNLFKVTPAMGIQMKKAIMIEVDDRTEAYLRVLRQKVTSDTQIVVCLLSSNRKDKYDAIKKYLCTDCPTPSQCVVARTLGKQQTAMAIATKIALQMSCKMGGELWRVDMPLKLAMIVGIDCYHDTTAGRRSIAGFVASINEGMTRPRPGAGGRTQGVPASGSAGVEQLQRVHAEPDHCVPGRRGRRPAEDTGELRGSAVLGLPEVPRERLQPKTDSDCGEETRERQIFCPLWRKTSEPPARDCHRRGGHQARVVRLLHREPGRAERQCVPHTLQCHLRQQRPEAGPHPAADVQALPHLLQLAGHHPRPCAVPVCAQAGLPGGPEHPQRAKPVPVQPPLLPLTSPAAARFPPSLPGCQAFTVTFLGETWEEHG